MKISELLETKVEMCPEACCGKPVTECGCGPDCKHCDCYAKNKEMSEGRFKSKLHRKASRAGKASGRRKKSGLGETLSAGGMGAGSVATTGNGFASGGIGTISRAGTTAPKKRKKKSNKA